MRPLLVTNWQSKSIRWDGHTHSQFCPHGSKEPTQLMIEKALQAGFTHYSITEHAPLPEELLKQKDTPQDSSLHSQELAPYLRHLKELKLFYKNKIQIFIGLEVDYLIGFEEFTQELLLQNQSELDEIVLSLHFLPLTKNLQNLKILDKSKESFNSNFGHLTLEKIWSIYWLAIEKMVTQKWLFSKPIRLGHLALIEKYSKQYPVDNATKTKWLNFILTKILPLTKKQGYSLDYNLAGMRKADCGRAYFYPELLAECAKLQIPLIYGSDAHKVSEVASHYNLYQKIF